MTDPRRGQPPSTEHGLELQPFLEAQRLRPSANVEELKRASGMIERWRLIEM